MFKRFHQDKTFRWKTLTTLKMYSDFPKHVGESPAVKALYVSNDEHCGLSKLALLDILYTIATERVSVTVALEKKKGFSKE